MFQYFSHNTLKRCIAVFGTLFNNIKIVRTLESSGSPIQQLHVPLTYGPRNKILARLQRETEPQAVSYALTLPRLSFEINSLTYSPDTSVSMMNRVVHKVVQPTGSPPLRRTMTQSRAWTPYKIGMTLYAYTNNQDDGFQIIEQILPYFKPDFIVTIKQIEATDGKWDMPITLTSVQPTDEYEGDYLTRRAIIWALSFDIGIRMYGPISSVGVIHKAIATFYDTDNEDIRYDRVTVEAVTSQNEVGYEINTTYQDLFTE